MFRLKRTLMSLLIPLLVLASFSCCPKNHIIDDGEKMASWKPKIVHYLPTADPVLEYWNGRRKEEEEN